MMAIAARFILFLTLAAAVVASQHAYDAARAGQADLKKVPSAGLIKAFDLGLHSAAASFLWIGTRSELPFFPEGTEHFFEGLQLVNDLDPRFSAPYAFTVLVLPSISSYADRIPAALAVGTRGLAATDPDWRIPFYMGAIYQLELNDRQNAARHFDRAAVTPGVPEPVRRFAINYGIRPDSLAATKAAWQVIHETASEPHARDRAAAHVAHLEILEHLNAAAQRFHQQFGRYPDSVEELANKGVIAGIPRSPFGFSFKIYDRGAVGIAP